MISRYTNSKRLLLLLALAAAVYLVHMAVQHPAESGSVPGSMNTTGEGHAKKSWRATRQKPFFHKIQKKPTSTTKSKSKAKAKADDTTSSDKHALTDHPLRTSNLDVEFPGLEINARGHVVYDPAAHGKKHPIRLLMERARKQAAQLDARIKGVKSLQDAVDDYRRAWGMDPPKGIDAWYKFVTATNSVPLPSLFPMAHKPFLQFLSLPPAVLRKRIEEMEAKSIKDKNTPLYSLTFVPDGKGDKGTACAEHEEWFPEDWAERGRGRVIVGGGKAWSWRCNNTLNLMLPILPKLPDEFFNMDPPLKLVFNADDGPRGQVHYEFQQRSETYGKAGKVWAPAQLLAAEQAQRWTYGWQWTCPEDSPLKQRSLSTVLNEDDADDNSIDGVKTFIGDFYMSTDVCYNPELREQNSFALSDQRLANVPLAPHISVSRSLRNSDITMVALDAVFQDVPLVKWKSKTHAKVFWRGSPTGLSHKKGNPWRQSQRHRLNFFANNASTAALEILVERGDVVRAEAHRVKDMNEKWFDIGISGGATQCSREDGTCEELANTVPWKDVVRGPETLLYKYVVDVDGNAWSSRFRRLLLSNHCVLKSTAYVEWFNDILVPWYHYVPIRHDYTDMYDIMAFFEGAPDGSTKGHTELAGEIAMNGVNFVNEHWRVPDMQSFTLLIFLEYWRLLSDDRAAVSYP